MTELSLDVLGVAARLRCAHAPVLEELRRDFEYFVAPDAGAPDVRLDLELGDPPASARPGPWRGPGYRARDGRQEREILYDDGSWARYDYARRLGRVVSPRPARLRELGYLAALSRVGEELDRRSMHRVHALGLEHRGAGALVLLPSGGGKSTLALELLRESPLRLLSEDTPVVAADGSLRAFPLRLGFRAGAPLDGVPAALRRPFERRAHGPKTLVDLPFFRDRVAETARPRWLLLGRRGHGPARLRPAGRARAAAALAVNLVAGWGVAQMSEYMLRPSPACAAGLARIAAARARAAAALLRRCEPLEFELGPDPARAAALLSRLLGA